MKPILRHGRRTFLQGSTFALALPFLETLAPRTARGQGIVAPKRFLAYMYPNGMWMDAWRPTGTGSNFKLGPAMGPQGRVFNDGLGTFPSSEDGPGLDAVLGDILIVSGLQNTFQCCGPGDHAGGFGACLTNRSVPKTASGQLAGPSIDYLIGQTLGKGTALPNLALSAQTLYPPGYGCDNGYSCAVADHICFDANGLNVTTYDDPALTFDQLFSNVHPGTNTAAVAAAAAVRAQNKSLLDLVTAEATSLRPKLSYQDRPRFDQFTSSIREVELRIAATATTSSLSCTPPARPSSGYNLSNGRATIDLVHQLITLGFQCDATRVMSLMWGANTCQRPYDFIGASGGHHQNSHHGGDATMIAKLQRIDYWWFRRFSALIGTLKSLPDIDGRTILDNTVIFQGSDVSDGDAHNHNDMPVVLAGGGCGFKMGQRLDFSTSGTDPGNGARLPSPGNLSGHSYGELFISIAQGLGVNISTFGEHGTGPLAGLT
jgi:hypothetical protein